MAFLEQASTLIKDQALVDAARDVKLYADYVAGKHGQIASDLLLTAVWCCLNPSVVGKRAALYRGQKASQNAKRSKAKTENARKKDKANIKENANTERKGSAEKERSQDPKAKDDGKMQDGIGGQQYFDMDCLEVDNEANVDQLSDESVRKPNTSDSINDTIVNEMDEQNKLEKRQLASNVDSSPLKGDSFEVYAIEDKTVATAEVIDLDSDTEAVISKPRPVSDTDENSDNADLSETVGNESATDPETGGDMSKNSFSDFEQSHGNAGSSVYQTTSDLETYASPACIPGLVPVSQTYTSRSRRKLQHTVKYEEAEIDNALYEMQEAERDDYEEDEPMAKGQQIITVKEECNYSGVGDESADQSNLYQPAYQDPCSSQQTFCQPVFVCPAPKRRLLDHDKKWNSQPDFSPDQLKYLSPSFDIDTSSCRKVKVKRKSSEALFNKKTESITMPGIDNSENCLQLDSSVSVGELDSDVNISCCTSIDLFMEVENVESGCEEADENGAESDNDFYNLNKKERQKGRSGNKKGKSSNSPKENTNCKREFHGEKRGDKYSNIDRKNTKWPNLNKLVEVSNNIEKCKVNDRGTFIEGNPPVKNTNRLRSGRGRNKIGFYSVKNSKCSRDSSTQKEMFSRERNVSRNTNHNMKPIKDLGVGGERDKTAMLSKGGTKLVDVNNLKPGRVDSYPDASEVSCISPDKDIEKESDSSSHTTFERRNQISSEGDDVSTSVHRKGRSSESIHSTGGCQNQGSCRPNKIEKVNEKSSRKRSQKSAMTNVKVNIEEDYDESEVIWID